MNQDLARESKFQWLARFGFVMRGVLYIVIAMLVIGTGRTEDLTGAMEYLDRGAGRWLLMLMVAGMFGYGLWRVSDAAFGSCTSAIRYCLSCTGMKPFGTTWNSTHVSASRPAKTPIVMPR